MCNNTVYAGLNGDEVLSEAPNVTVVLEAGLPILVYSGDLDYQCNWFGGHNWTNHLYWSGQTQFENAEFEELSDYGEFKNYEKFTFYKVFKAGHLVPHDQPAAALDMLTRFINNNGTLTAKEDSYEEFI